MSAMKQHLRLVRLPIGRRRKAALRLARRVLRDEVGGEVLEYALIAGLIVVGAIATVGCVGQKVLARWTSLNSSI